MWLMKESLGEDGARISQADRRVGPVQVSSVCMCVCVCVCVCLCVCACVCLCEGRVCEGATEPPR